MNTHEENSIILQFKSFSIKVNDLQNMIGENQNAPSGHE